MMTLETLQALLAAVTPPDLYPGPRPGLPPLPQLQAQLNDVLAKTQVPGVGRDLLRGLVLLWHDELELAHQIAQGISTADGSYLHGMMHRREPDYGNAKYWFHRVGRHTAFEALASKADGWLTPYPKLHKQLFTQGEWDPMGFIDACEIVSSRSPDDPESLLLRRIQAEEFHFLLAYWSEAKPG